MLLACPPLSNLLGVTTMPKRRRLTELERIPCTIAPQDFFERFVATRTPCILTGWTVNLLDSLKSVDCTVQVEQRATVNDPFGQSRDRNVTMSFQDFLKHLNGPDHALYYLSTQETDQIVAPPCHQLKLPTTLPWLPHLQLQSLNLWMGHFDDDAHSGLHHDFHDNLYCLVEGGGTKSFRLYPASEHASMALYGTVHEVHENGLITYEPTRADGVPLAALEEEDGDASDDDSDEEEIVIGKGFDYESEEEFDAERQDDYDALVNDEPVERPNNFSRIDPTRPRDELRKEYPDFWALDELQVTIQAGECLYLPASWFHCVTSKGRHTAVNYWFHPPDNLQSFEQPYKDDYWARQASS